MSWGEVLVAQLCLPLCDPMDYSPPGSSVHGIFQARTLEWVAISFSRGASQPRDQTHVSCLSCIGRWVLYHQQHLEASWGEKCIQSRVSRIAGHNKEV